MSLKDIKNFNLDTITLEDAIALSVEAKAVRAGFEAEQVEIPEWLDNKIRELARFVNMTKADRLDKRTRELKASLSALETTGEKRARLQKELDALEGRTAEPVGASK